VVQFRHNLREIPLCYGGYSAIIAVAQGGLDVLRDPDAAAIEATATSGIRLPQSPDHSADTRTSPQP
jgi:hypothetical protein